MIIGTAGHIDHGKTALVRALTGIETDTLPEELSRGVTIDIGFAYWRDNVTIIDVPGHERFVKNMVTGVCTVDLAIFVIAADDGPMPQTHEHLGILNLLGVKRGVIALTKTDLVDSDWVELVKEEIRDLVSNTFLEDVPIVPVSSETGEGIEDLHQVIEDEIERVGTRLDRGVFRLPIDRAFSVRGFGTVVTGTIISGSVGTRDEAVLLPSGNEIRVRGIQTHGKDVDEAHVGARAAVNIAGVEVHDVKRGDLLCEPGYFHTTYMIDVRLIALADAPVPIKNRTRVHLHLGPREVLARVILLESDELTPGESELAQLRLEEPGIAAKGDRFVIRRYSPVVTLGGGIVIDASPVKHGRMKPDVNEDIALLENDDPAEVLEARLRAIGWTAMTAGQIASDLAISEQVAGEIIESLLKKGRIASYLSGGGSCFVHSENLDRLKMVVSDAFSGYHNAYPLSGGLRRRELKDLVPGHYEDSVYEVAVESLLREGILASEGAVLRKSDHKIRFFGEHEAIRDQIMSELVKGGAAPPDLVDLTSKHADGSVDAIVEAMRNVGDLVRLDDGLVFAPQVLSDIETKIVTFLQGRGEMGVGDFRDLVGTTRKYAVPLLNHFDSNGLTERKGDVRVLRSRGQ
ncbi:MAG: selenocysteine-specific translation elongation factor [Candidatus Latescibacterota bacterium]|nr:selenocysteine-specific translation elongation factor [Candidatus Latescibacterota bacterium]